MTILGLDIGGANLKAADGRGWARSMPFALWQEPQNLAAMLGEMIASAPAAERVAVTMTGELCDCFRSKADGVLHIVEAAQEAAAEREVEIYLADGRLVSPDEVRIAPQLAAASNWHALARFACRFAGDRSALLIDVGSTTTDVIPLFAGRVVACGATDIERLLAGELVYSGVDRTPICAIVSELPYRGQNCPVAAELFATTADAYVLLGELPEQDTAGWTADGRPLTLEYCRERLARMICADRATFDDVDARAAAAAIRDAQLARIRFAVEQVCSKFEDPPNRCIISGAGEPLATRLAASMWGLDEVISLASTLGPDAGKCAPAHALAVLAREATV